jgi:hypothetical protein
VLEADPTGATAGRPWAVRISSSADECHHPPGAVYTFEVSWKAWPEGVFDHTMPGA